MDLKELMIYCSGVDEHKMPKASVVLVNDLWKDNGEKETIDEMHTDAPVIQFFAGDGFVTLDLDFGSKHNIDLDMVNDFLNAFRIPENSAGEDTKIPVTTVAVIPNNHEEKYVIACINPIIHCLTAKAPTADLSIVRMTFMSDTVALFEDELFEYEEDEE